MVNHHIILWLTLIQTCLTMFQLCSQQLSSASAKAKLFVENFSRNPDLDGLGISLCIVPSRTNLKLHNLSVTPKMVKKVIMNLDCILVVVLKKCEPEVSYILAELFNKCLKESCFTDC